MTRQGREVNEVKAFAETKTARLTVSPAATADPEATPKIEVPANRAVSSLLRWEHHQLLRDAVIDYAKREHHSVHTVLIESIRRGLAQIDREGWAPAIRSNNVNSSTARSSRQKRGSRLVIEVSAYAYQEDDETWTIEIPRLTSKTPSGETIVATGSASSSRGIAQAALELASAWLDVAPDEVAVHVTVDEP